MGKNRDKKPTVEAPVVDPKPAVEEAATEQPQVINPTTAKKGLSQDSKVAYMTELRMRKQELLEEDNPPIEYIKSLDLIRDVAIIDIAAGEISCGGSAMGYMLIANEENYNALQLAASFHGVRLPAFKTLPQPTKAQLAQAGIAEIGTTRALPTSKIEISKEAAEKKKKEKKLNDDAESGKKEYLTDPTKIQTDDQLKEALGFQLSNTKVPSPLDRLIQSANFLRSYRDVVAEKSDDPQAEHAKNKELSTADLLQDISTMVPASFTAEGFGRLLCKTIIDSESIVPAFEMLKRCGRKRNSTEFKYSDEEIAAMARVLVVWKASAAIADLGKEVKRLTEKDAKKNADAIATANEAIKKEQEFMSYVTDPKFDLADNFLAAYNDKENPLHKSAIAAAKSIIETHYKDADVPELEMDSLLLNIQQHIGMDLNLFNSNDLRRDEYSADNLIEFKQKAKPAEEPADGEGKNA